VTQRNSPGTQARATSTTPIAETDYSSGPDTDWAARGKAVVDSGKHAPAPRQWTADELRYWFTPQQPCDVANLDDYRQRRRGVTS
jgi:hypothetical protein